MTKAKTLILDIETAPILASVWRTWKENVGLDQINHDWYILSFCAKWLGKDRSFYYDQSEAADIEDDRGLMQKLHSLLSEADIVVAHNGRRFDLRKINARFVLNGFPPPSPYKVVDTLDIAKKHFAFTSNRLAYLTDVLCTEKKLAHAKFPGFKLWKECLNGNAEAWEEMREYNTQDVVSLEELYLILRPWAEGHPNVAAYDDDEVTKCPKCGSTDVRPRGFYFTQTGKYQRLRCNGCGGWSRTRYTINTVGKRKALLSN